jgi:hypothetical protein
MARPVSKVKQGNLENRVNRASQVSRASRVQKVSRMKPVSSLVNLVKVSPARASLVRGNRGRGNRGSRVRGNRDNRVKGSSQGNRVTRNLAEAKGSQVHQLSKWQKPPSH